MGDGLGDVFVGLGMVWGMPWGRFWKGFGLRIGLGDDVWESSATNQNTA